jgi:hypothetical protein
MSTKTVYLPFYIVLTDAAEVATLQAKYPKGVNRAPYDPSVNGTGVPGGAAIEFNAPFVGVSDVGQHAPYTYAPTAAHVGGSQYPTNVATFSQHSGGFFGLFGTTTQFYWIGTFKLASATTDPAGGATPENLQVRRWAEGWELDGLGGNISGGLTITREASRHIGGWGLSYSGTNAAENIPLTKFATGLPASPTSWERFYVRVRSYPSVAGFPLIWRCRGSNSPASGAGIGVAPGGDAYLFNIDNVSTRTFQAIIGKFPLWTGHPDNDAWVRIDLLIYYGSALAGGKLSVYWNGKHVGDYVGIAGTGLASTGGGHQSSEIGSSYGTNDLEFDCDDWTNCTIPTLFTGRDWLNGTKIVRVKPKAFSGSNVWVGAVQTLMQNIRAAINGATISSTTASALCEVTTDDDIQISADKDQIGVASALVRVESAATGLSGLLGFKRSGQAAADTALVESSTHTNRFVFYTNPGTAPTYPAVAPMTLRYTKGADALAANLRALDAAYEVNGTFGACDVNPANITGTTVPTFPGDMGPHNAPYPRSQWATQSKAGVIAPYVIIGGTYVGNGTGQDISLPYPVHFLHIRNVSTNANFIWWSSMAGPHPAWDEMIDDSIADISEDLTFVPVQAPDNRQQGYVVRIAGASASLNAAATTYQYVAICDPGARFMLNGCMTHLNTTLQDMPNPLIDPNYTPEFGFFEQETDSATTTQRLYTQGPANSPATIQNVGGASTGAALTMAQGLITTKAALHSIMSGNPMAYMLWRRADGNNDPGQPGVVALASWTGAGGTARTVNLAPASGKRPLFAMVFGQGGAAYWRDPSHTGTNSAKNDNSVSTTGITAGGIDQITVGSSLDTNGIIFNAIIWFADANAGNNGWGINGTFAPVEAAVTDGGINDPNIADVLAQDGTTGTGTGTGAPGTPTIPGDITTDLATTCLPFSTQLANIALARLGVSKKIVSLATDVTVEAEQARLHWGTDVEQTLRDHPWGFATRYADLVLVAGSETVKATADWQYSYRAPDGMMKARRIVGQLDQRRHYDPHPITFRVGADDTGTLIYTNAEILDGMPVTLEYTVRVACPAGVGDAIFRSAFAWRLAASMAPTLSRDAQKAAFCLQMYQATFADATTEDAQEQQQDKDGNADWILGRN